MKELCFKRELQKMTSGNSYQVFLASVLNTIMDGLKVANLPLTGESIIYALNEPSNLYDTVISSPDLNLKKRLKILSSYRREDSNRISAVLTPILYRILH